MWGHNNAPSPPVGKEKCFDASSTIRWCAQACAARARGGWTNGFGSCPGGAELRLYKRTSARAHSGRVARRRSVLTRTAAARARGRLGLRNPGRIKRLGPRTPDVFRRCCSDIPLPWQRSGRRGSCVRLLGSSPVRLGRIACQCDDSPAQSPPRRRSDVSTHPSLPGRYATTGESGALWTGMVGCVWSVLQGARRKHGSSERRALGTPPDNGAARL